MKPTKVDSPCEAARCRNKGQLTALCGKRLLIACIGKLLSMGFEL